MHAARFTIALWCVLVAALLPIACAYLAKRGGFGKARGQGGFDNHAPRAWLARQSGWQARANAAQANSFEALPFFIGAVLTAHWLGAAQALLDALALSYLALRMVYVAMYLLDKPAARSASWAAAFALNIAILFIGYR